jgi:O-acetyl-ADP-ribose deacetylase (regulator of RNase III)
MNAIVIENLLPSGQHLQLVEGDLTLEKVDAIVNAANAHLLHGGGVAGAILRRGGPAIQAESQAWIREHGPVTHEAPAFTRGGNLPCRYVIHAVGPVWGEGDEDRKLEVAVTGALGLADRLNLASIAFPAISTGIYGFPKERAARISLNAIRKYFTHYPGSGLRQVRLVLFDRPTLEVFREVWEGEQGIGD